MILATKVESIVEDMLKKENYFDVIYSLMIACETIQEKLISEETRRTTVENLLAEEIGLNSKLTDENKSLKFEIARLERQINKTLI